MTHHTNLDSYERLQPSDMQKNATIAAGFAYLAANRDEKLPRKPLTVPVAGRTARVGTRPSTRLLSLRSLRVRRSGAGFGIRKRTGRLGKLPDRPVLFCSLLASGFLILASYFLLLASGFYLPACSCSRARSRSSRAVFATPARSRSVCLPAESASWATTSECSVVGSGTECPPV